MTLETARPLAKAIAAKGIVNDVIAELKNIGVRVPPIAAVAVEGLAAIVVRHLDSYDQRG